MVIREPSVAGTFYPENAEVLRAYLEDHLSSSNHSFLAKAVVVPHAGYVYSGEVASQVFSRIKIPSKIFIMGPNHQGIGPSFALASPGKWETPFGPAAIDQDLIHQLAASHPALKISALAHQNEHSLEVEIPMIQYLNSGISLCPLIVGTLNLEEAREVALRVADVLAGLPELPLIIISSDMNHYEEDRRTRVKDGYALRAIEFLDAEGLVAAVKTHRISMCGFVPVYMLLCMASKLGIQRASLVDYRTSGEVNGNYDQVVGYAGFIFE